MVEELMEQAQADCERMGHSYNEGADWEFEDGYRYSRACAECGFTLVVDTDAQEYDWNAIPACHEWDWDPNRFYTIPR